MASDALLGSSNSDHSMSSKLKLLCGMCAYPSLLPLQPDRYDNNTAAVGFFLFGYDTVCLVEICFIIIVISYQGVISGALLKIAEDFDLSPTDKEAIVSTTVAGAIAGAVGAGGLTSKVCTLLLKQIGFGDCGL